MEGQLAYLCKSAENNRAEGRYKKMSFGEIVKKKRLKNVLIFAPLDQPAGTPEREAVISLPYIVKKDFAHFLNTLLPVLSHLLWERHSRGPMKTKITCTNVLPLQEF